MYEWLPFSEQIQTRLSRAADDKTKWRSVSCVFSRSMHRTKKSKSLFLIDLRPVIQMPTSAIHFDLFTVLCAHFKQVHTSSTWCAYRTGCHQCDAGVPHAGLENKETSLYSLQSIIHVVYAHTPFLLPRPSHLDTRTYSNNIIIIIILSFGVYVRTTTVLYGLRPLVGANWKMAKLCSKPL